MRGKSGVALGLAIGYVLGTKAGRERYEQLSQSAKRLANDPSLQRLQTELSGLLSASRQQARATIEGTATRAADKLEEVRESPAGGQASGTSSADSASSKPRSSRSSSSSSGSGSSRSRSSTSTPRSPGQSGSA